MDNFGQERYDSINMSYLPNMDAVLLVYDISDKQSFNKVIYFYNVKIKELCKKDIPVILIGNKIDKNDKREVSSEEGEEFAKNQNWAFLESSCLFYKNVFEAFKILIENWISKIFHESINELKKYIGFKEKNFKKILNKYSKF